MQRFVLLVFAACLVGSAGCDHATKGVARAVLADAPLVSVWSDVVRFELASNPGAFLSLGAGLPAPARALLFGLGVPLLVLAVVALGWRGLDRSPTVGAGLGLVAGGGLANWLDRLANDGAVTDFVSLGVGSLRTGIFNVADVCILAGVALLLARSRATPATEERPT